MHKELNNNNFKKKALFVLILFISIISLILFIKKSQNLKESPIKCLDCNIVLVSFDTLRASNVGTYGYPKNTTPTIDQFAKSGFTFSNAISVAPWTLPSHMSWFTGVYPSQHKVLNKFTVKEDGTEKITNLKKVSPGIITLAEILKQEGYKTGGFTGGAGVHHQFGFDKGFDIYTDDKDFGGFSDSTPKALAWIKEHKNEKLFVFLHGYDIHGQFVPEKGYDYRFLDFEYKGDLDGSKEEQKELREEGLTRGQIFLTKEDVKFLVALYDEKISRADEKFSEFIDEYEKLGLMDKTIFILTSDHGEELYEHGRIDHGHSLYDELIKVPLIIRIPSITKGEKIDDQVRSIDLMPTILDTVDIEPAEELGKHMEGISLTSLMNGEKVLLNVFPETDYRYSTFIRAIRTPEYFKLINDLETNIEELYNLNADPEEKDDIAESKKDVAYTLKQKLLEHLNSFR